MRYKTEKDAKIVEFETVILVPKEKDPVRTYYMACGFKGGYFGMQVSRATETPQ